jgi:hypothetical protein
MTGKKNRHFALALTVVKKAPVGKYTGRYSHISQPERTWLIPVVFYVYKVTLV